MKLWGGESSEQIGGLQLRVIIPTRCSDLEVVAKQPGRARAFARRGHHQVEPDGVAVARTNGAPC